MAYCSLFSIVINALMQENLRSSFIGIPSIRQTYLFLFARSNAEKVFFVSGF
jgi:hypothetical protein